MSEKLTYTKAIAELEEIVKQIESEEVLVEELLIKVKRSSELIKFCKRQLHSTENEITDVLKEMEE